MSTDLPRPLRSGHGVRKEQAGRACRRKSISTRSLLSRLRLFSAVTSAKTAVRGVRPKEALSENENDVLRWNPSLQLIPWPKASYAVLPITSLPCSSPTKTATAKRHAPRCRLGEIPGQMIDARSLGCLRWCSRNRDTRNRPPTGESRGRPHAKFGSTSGCRSVRLQLKPLRYNGQPSTVRYLDYRASEVHLSMHNQFLVVSRKSTLLSQTARVADLP
jgi:hypothetical protein